MFTVPEEKVTMNLSGVLDDYHNSRTVFSGNRMKTLYEPGTIVRNNRQWSAISPDEVEVIAGNLDLENRLDAGHIGINFLIRGIPELSKFPSMTYLVFSPENGDFKPRRVNDVVLVTYAQAIPCAIQGKALAKEFGMPELESKFPKASMGYRGIVGWVEKGGVIKPGYTVWALTPKGID